jgi:hypothetical protein
MSDSDAPGFAWDVRREGRSWSGDEWKVRRELRPEKIEMSRGLLFWSDEDRLNMLVLLLENVGADQAVRLGNPGVWRAAIEALDRADGDYAMARDIGVYREAGGELLYVEPLGSEAGPSASGGRSQRPRSSFP